MKPYRQGLLAPALASAVLMSSAAFAGFRSGTDVVINDASRWAYGDLGQVHNSSDRTQLIGCYNTINFAGWDGGCYAQNTSGVWRSCYTTDPNMMASVMATLRSVSGNSYLTFTWDGAGRCTDLSVENDSMTSPKT
jgi:hypothetical protein